MPYPSARQASPEAAYPQLPSQARRPVVDVVSALAGISLARVEDDRPFTWTATDDVASALDGCQYLTGGPCVTAAEERRVVAYDGPRSPGTEAWSTFVRASSQAGVRATLSLPVFAEPAVEEHGHVGGARVGTVVGTVNLYARKGTAFDGRVDDLVRWCATWAPARALAKRPPTFGSRLERALAPERMRDENSIDRAVAVLVERLGTDVADAADRLRMAAVRAGTTESSLAWALNATAT
jgi:hypothetical protein